jgi:hypothetical protein
MQVVSWRTSIFTPASIYISPHVSNFRSSCQSPISLAKKQRLRSSQIKVACAAAIKGRPRATNTSKKKWYHNGHVTALQKEGNDPAEILPFLRSLVMNAGFV